MHGQSSFAIHLPMAVAVVGLATWLECSITQWCILLLCIALVLALELVNSSLESLAKGLCTEHNDWVGRGLDIASAAVLLASIFSAIVGSLIFAQQLGML